MNKRTMIAIILIAIIAVVAIPAIYFSSLPAENKVTIELWDSMGGEWTWEAFFAWWTTNYHQNHSDVDFEITHYTFSTYFPKLTAALSAGTPPDLFHMHGYYALEPYVEAGQIADLTSLFSEPWALEQISDTERKPYTFNGHVYGIPFDVSYGTLQINEALFEQAGVPIPGIDEAWTWDEFLDVCETFKEAGITPLGFTGGAPYFMQIPDYLLQRCAGVDNFKNTYENNPGYDFNTAPYILAHTLLKDLVQRDYFQDNWETHDFMDVIGAFEREEIAMWCSSVWTTYIILDDNPDIRLTSIRFPTVPVEQGGTGEDDVLLEYLGFMVPEACEHKEEVFDCIRYLCSDEVLLEYAKNTGIPYQNVDIPPGTFPSHVEKGAEMASMDAKPLLGIDDVLAGAWGEEYWGLLDQLIQGTITPAELCEQLEIFTEDFTTP